MYKRFLVLTALLATSACVPPPPPPAPQPAPEPVAPAPTPAPVQPQRPAGEWIDWSLAPGDWSYSRDALGSTAAFGPPGAAPQVTLRCDAAARIVYLRREGSGARGYITIRTSSARETFSAIAISSAVATGSADTTGATLGLAAPIKPTDPILDAMALSRGRIAIEADGAQPIAIPSWAEITKVVEDCRA